MKSQLKSVIKKVLGVSPKFNPEKRQLIDYAGQYLKIESFADLGGVWEVNGFYTFYALERYKCHQAFLVDTDISPVVRKKAKKYPGLTLLDGNFGDKSIPQKIGKVDCVFLFDVLIHQVKPDWNEILDMYAAVTDCFVLFNPQYTASKKTVRLVDMSYEEYFANVPHAKDHPVYKAAFEHPYEMHPQHQRIWRDIHNIWQWGITDGDLIAKLTELGFTMYYYKNVGSKSRLKNFQKHAFVFKR